MQGKQNTHWLNTDNKCSEQIVAKGNLASNINQEVMIMKANAEMILRYYGMKTQSEVSRLSAEREAVITAAIDRANGDITAIKEHIDRYAPLYDDYNDKYSAVRRARFADCFNTFNPNPLVVQPAQDTENKPEINPTPVTDNQVQYSMSVLKQAVIQLISKTQTERIESEIMGQVQDEVRSFIKSEYGEIERKITTVIDGKKVKVDGVQHEKFETVLKFVANNEPVFLTGAAGSGKNVLCKQVAQALGLDFYFTNAVTQEYKLTGFTDANGVYQQTQFYKAFTQGGVFMLDEMDASIPEVLIILNAAIANRYFDFPAPIGYVEAHPNFRVIAAGNTIGQGADFEYVGRNQLDAASLDRFAVIEIDYSPTIENAVAGGDTELVEFCRAFRAEAQKAGCAVIVSYRGIGRLAKMMQILTIEDALKTCLIKGLEADSVRMIAHNLPTSKYKSALEKIAA